MQAAHRVAKNTGILYAKMAITMFISLYTTRLVLLALGSKDFGLFNIVGGAIAMLGFLNASMAGATQRFMSFSQGAGDIDRINKIFNMSILLHLVIAFFLFVILEIAGYFFFNGILNIESDRIGIAKLIYQFMIISTLFTVISVPYNALLNAYENMLFFSILGIIESVFKLGIALYITYTISDKLLYYGVLMAFSSIILLVINRIYCHRKYAESKIALKTHYDKSLLKEMSSFAGWSLLGSASSMTANYGQGIILNNFFGTTVNAAQGISSQVSGQLGTFATTMLKALNPVIDKSEGAGDRQAMLKASMFGSKISFFLLLFFYVPVFLELPFILKLWLKELPEYVVIFCRLLLIRNLVEQLFSTLNSAITAVGRIRKFQIYSSILNIFPLVIIYFLFTNGFSPYVAYYVFVFYSIINSSLMLYTARNRCNLSIPLYLKDVVFKCLASLFIIGFLTSLSILFLSEGLLRLTVTISVSLVFFVLVVWSVGLQKGERNEIVKLSNKILNYFK